MSPPDEPGPTDRAVFLDKDGTLIVDVPYNVDPALITLAPGAAEGLPRLHAAGFRLVVITNQSGVARGRFGIEALEPVEDRLRELLAELGVPLAGFWFCPHHPDGAVAEYAIPCDCRKPAPGMVVRAAAELGIDLARSWFVGDILNDVEAGHRAGCRTILLGVGHETQWLLGPDRTPDLIAGDLDEAATLILQADTAATTGAFA